MFWQNTFKVVCCKIVVWGKGLKLYSLIILSLKEVFQMFVFLSQISVICCRIAVCGERAQSCLHLRQILKHLDFFLGLLPNLNPFWHTCTSKLRQTTSNPGKIVNNFFKRKYYYWIELKILWQKGEISHHEQCLLLPLCFRKVIKKVCTRKGIKGEIFILWNFSFSIK